MAARRTIRNRANSASTRPRPNSAAASVNERLDEISWQLSTLATRLEWLLGSYADRWPPTEPRPALPFRSDSDTSGTLGRSAG